MFKCNDCEKTFNVSDIKRVPYKTVYSRTGWEVEEQCMFCGSANIEHIQTEQPKEERKRKRKIYYGKQTEYKDNEMMQRFAPNDKMYDECGNCINQIQEF